MGKRMDILSLFKQLGSMRKLKNRGSTDRHHYHGTGIVPASSRRTRRRTRNSKARRCGHDV